jgi:ferredoxin
MECLKIDIELCVGCGQCALVCEFNAIHSEWGEARVREDFCIQCGTCIDFCPVEAISFGEK